MNTVEFKNENEMLTINTLITRKGSMYELYEIKEYKYKGEIKLKYLFYYVSSESGLIYKHKTLKLNQSDLKNYNILEWKWRK